MRYGKGWKGEIMMSERTVEDMIREVGEKNDRRKRAALSAVEGIPTEALEGGVVEEMKIVYIGLYHYLAEQSCESAREVGRPLEDRLKDVLAKLEGKEGEG